MNKKWSDNVLRYFKQLEEPVLPEGIGCMNPYTEPTTLAVVETFLSRYFNDHNKRTLIFGINPGRFGSGITGISFTDPIRLNAVLNIDHPFDMRPELSSEFIYEAISAFGGPKVFFDSFFITAVFPLGFLKDGKNINYYELTDWRAYLLEPIVAEINAQLEWNVNRRTCICIGKGTNYKVLRSLNQEYGWFEKVEVLPHPRWILQYRRKDKLNHLQQYLDVLIEASQQ